jgi:CheY-like chemotaxis protein
MGHDAQLALRSMLNTHDRDLSSAFNQDGRLSGLEDMLSSTTAAHIAMPFFTGNDAMFLILITTETNGHRFYDGETDFARSIGSVLKASAVQSRVIAADYKRIKVMSRVSHEMRTPVHGVLSSVDMLEESIKRKEFDQAADLLTYLHTSARDLKRLMNRILDEESSLQLGRKSLQDLRLESPTSPIEGPTADPISAQNDESQNNDDMLPLSPSTLPTDTNNISDYWNRANINDVTTPLMTPVSTETDPLASIPLKVLIVEDNEISRKILIMSVKRLDKGISITEARDGVEGLTAFCQGQPDLVLTDVNMPVLDGIGSAKAMRTIELAQNWPRCQIFTVTGLGQADSKLKADALNGTVDGWLVKGQHRLQDIQAIVKNAQDTKRNRL